MRTHEQTVSHGDTTQSAEVIPLIVERRSLEKRVYETLQESGTAGLQKLFRKVVARKDTICPYEFSKFIDAYWEARLHNCIRKGHYRIVWTFILKILENDVLDPYVLTNHKIPSIARRLYLALGDKIENPFQSGVHRLKKPRHIEGLPVLLRLNPYSELSKGMTPPSSLRAGTHYVYWYEAEILSLAQHFAKQ